MTARLEGTYSIPLAWCYMVTTHPKVRGTVRSGPTNWKNSSAFMLNSGLPNPTSVLNSATVGKEGGNCWHSLYVEVMQRQKPFDA